jgi:adenine-specific DNA methylase
MIAESTLARSFRPNRARHFASNARAASAAFASSRLLHAAASLSPSTFSDLVREARERVLRDAVAAGLPDDGLRLVAGGTAAPAYADALATYLAFLVSRLADRGSNICSWDIREGPGRESGVRNVFARQAIPMSWDFAEANPLS